MGSMEGLPESMRPRRTPEWEPYLPNVEREPDFQHVSAIYIAPKMGAPMISLDRVNALAGIGLQGDRYAIREGVYSTRKKSKKKPRIPDEDRQVTLIAQQQIEIGNAILKQMGIEPITENQTRRNLVVTLSADQLNALVGARFIVG